MTERGGIRGFFARTFPVFASPSGRLANRSRELPTLDCDLHASVCSISITFAVALHMAVFKLAWG